MRIATWNVRRRSGRSLRPFVEEIGADVLVMTEAVEGATGGSADLFPDAPRRFAAVYKTVGIEVVTSPSFVAHPREHGAPAEDCAVAVDVMGPVAFPLLGIWTHPRRSTRAELQSKRPRYFMAALNALDVHADWLGFGRGVVMGDFNTSAGLPKPADVQDHLLLVRELETRFGLVSAYHAFHRVAHGEERDATHYWRYAEKDAFHLDYVFVPREWVIRDVRVGAFEVWGKRSDHVPVIVGVA